MTTREEASALVRRMQESFNSRRFDEADDLSVPGVYSHPLGASGDEARKQAWSMITAQFPGMRVVAQDILVDGDKAAVRSVVEGVTAPGGEQPMLFEIFRFEDGRFAESWGASTGFPASASPEELLS